TNPFGILVPPVRKGTDADQSRRRRCAARSSIKASCALHLNAIPRPQRLRLIGAAERIERIGGEACDVLGQKMVGAEGLLADRQCALVEQPGTCNVALFV